MIFKRTISSYKRGGKSNKEKQMDAARKLTTSNMVAGQAEKMKNSGIEANRPKPKVTVDMPTKNTKKTNASIVSDTKREATKRAEAKAAPKTRGQAFNAARKEGKSEFTWEGKQYHTKTAEEVAKEKEGTKSNAGSNNSNTSGNSETSTRTNTTERTNEIDPRANLDISKRFNPNAVYQQSAPTQDFSGEVYQSPDRIRYEQNRAKDKALGTSLNRFGTQVLNSIQTVGGSAVGDVLHSINPEMAEKVNKKAWGIFPHTTEEQYAANSSDNPDRWTNRTNNAAHAAGVGAATIVGGEAINYAAGRVAPAAGRLINTVRQRMPQTSYAPFMSDAAFSGGSQVLRDGTGKVVSQAFAYPGQVVGREGASQVSRIAAGSGQRAIGQGATQAVQGGGQRVIGQGAPKLKSFIDIITPPPAGPTITPKVPLQIGMGPGGRQLTFGF